jgi:hypothetical protein
MLIIASALARAAAAQSPSEARNYFSKDYIGISVAVKGTNETVPGENMTVYIWVNCTADNVKVDDLSLSVYGFIGGQEKILLNTTHTLTNAPLVFNETNQFEYNVSVPNNIWDSTFGELNLQYSILGTPFTENPSFSMTMIRNVYLEELEDQLRSLNQSYQELNSTYDQLNQTYWQLQQNYTSLQGSVFELDNTRRVVAVLVVISVFFVATTVYLFLRRPRDYW